MNFKPIKTKKIYEEIVEQIQNLISEGKLKPGEKIVSERELADQLQVGRSAVREAFRALEVMGLIEIRAGEGTFVREASKHHLIEPLALIMMMDSDSADDIMELRQILEIDAVALAAQRRQEVNLKKMRSALQRMEQDVSQGLLGEQADMDFHYAIIEATHNKLLVKVMNTLSDSMREALKGYRQVLFELPGKPKELLEQHKNIYEAIAQGNVELAKVSVKQHLDYVAKCMRGAE